jgi:phosphoinositide-3-kinase regulatory subunit 4
MGQGYSLTTLSAGSAGIDVPELSDLVYEKSMGGGRFMKSIRARQQNGLVFVKVIMKPYPTMQLEPYVKAIMSQSFCQLLITRVDANMPCRGTEALIGCTKCIEL